VREVPVDETEGSIGDGNGPRGSAVPTGHPGRRSGSGLGIVVPAQSSVEILFRGVLFRAAWDRGCPTLALIGTAMVFEAVHFNLGAPVPLSAFGLILALLTDRTGGLVARIAAHMSFGAAPFLFLLLGVDLGK